MKTSIEKASSLTDLQSLCRNCRGCGLFATRHNTVFGEGNGRADIVLVGEAPGAREDQCGRPFVGRAGEVLDQLLDKAGLAREALFITSVIKCRPPRNRNPRRDELKACRPFLDRQLALIRPRLVVCLGLVAAHSLLDAKIRMIDVGGRLLDGPGYRILPTYHPAAVLRGTVREALLVEHLRTAAEGLP